MIAHGTVREEITDVLLRYATGIDTKNWELLRTCFTDDVQADYGAIGQWSDADEITRFMSAIHEGMSDTKHMLHNMVVDLQGDERATAVTYLNTVQVMAADPTLWIEAVGQYNDELVRTAHGWKISKRTYTSTRLLTSPGFDLNFKTAH